MYEYCQLCHPQTTWELWRSLYSPGWVPPLRLHPLAVQTRDDIHLDMPARCRLRGRRYHSISKDFLGDERKLMLMLAFR